MIRSMQLRRFTIILLKSNWNKANAYDFIVHVRMFIKYLESTPGTYPAYHVEL